MTKPMGEAKGRAAEPMTADQFIKTWPHRGWYSTCQQREIAQLLEDYGAERRCQLKQGPTAEPMPETLGWVNDYFFNHPVAKYSVEDVARMLEAYIAERAGQLKQDLSKARAALDSLAALCPNYRHTKTDEECAAQIAERIRELEAERGRG